ncbi:MAG TPA: flagellar basal body P-ring formation chaperone FlgA [Alphaproteobacteria bacterium]|nr:flagellar basal body P-ring formation chaperone FlgA [Alphaproteobacteria bacterium]
MNKTVRYLLTLWMTLGACLGAPPCLADGPVTLKAETELNRVTVRLSDVFTNVPQDIDREIAQAPAPGKQVVYDVNVLTRLAQKYRLDWQAQSYADHVTIKEACVRITADMIREAIIQKVKASNIGTQKNAEIDVAFDAKNLEVDIPADQKADFTLNNFDYDQMNKRFRTDLVTASASGPAAFVVGGRITIKRSLPVLAHRLEGGTTIGEADIDFILVPEGRINGAVLTDARDVIGRELRRDTEGDEILHAQDVMQPRLVKRGTMVTMKIQTPLMQVTAQGRALQDGVVGDTVRLINTQSNRNVEGIVTGPDTVTIHTAMKFAEAQ